MNIAVPMQEANNALNENATEDVLWQIEARLSSCLSKKTKKLRQENQDCILDMIDRMNER